MEAAAVARLALDPDAPAHQFDQLRGDGQAEPRAAVAARRRRVGLHEGAEDLPLLVGRHADAGVRHGELRDRAVSRQHGPTRDVDDDLALLGELDGVADQVDDDLAQSARIADERVGHVRARCGTTSSRPFSCARGASSLTRVLDRVAEAERRADRASARRASIFEKSRMSLMMVSSESADSFTVRRYSRCCGRELACAAPARSCR